MNDLVQKIDEKCNFPAKIEYGSFSVPFTYFSLPNRKTDKLEFESFTMSGSLIVGAKNDCAKTGGFVPYGVYARKFFAWFVSWINMLIQYQSIPTGGVENIIYLPSISEIMKMCEVPRAKRQEFVEQMIAWFDITISFQNKITTNTGGGRCGEQRLKIIDGKNRNFARDYHIVLDKDKVDKNDCNWVKLDMDGFKILTCMFPLPFKEYCSFSSSLEMDIYSWLILRISDKTSYTLCNDYEKKISIPLNALVCQFSGAKNVSDVRYMKKRVLDSIFNIAKDHLQNNVHVQYDKETKNVVLNIKKDVYQNYLSDNIEKNEIKKLMKEELKKKECEKQAKLLQEQKEKFSSTVWENNEDIISRGLELALLERAKKENNQEFIKNHVKRLDLSSENKNKYPPLEETLHAFEKREQTKEYPLLRLFLTEEDVRMFNRLGKIQAEENSKKYDVSWGQAELYTKSQVKFLLDIYLKFGTITVYEKGDQK